MKYNAPYGTPEGTGYINGNPAAGLPGSIPPAAAFEQPQRELVALISNSNLTPSDGDLQQVTRAVRSQYLNFADALNIENGQQNDIRVNLLPTPGTPTPGMPLRIKIAQANTAAVTINVSDTGQFPAKRANGAALQSNDLLAGMVADFVFDGSVFQLVNFSGATGTGDIINNYATSDIPYIADTSGAANTITAIYAPALTAHTTGQYILVKLANTVTGQTTININALAGKIIKKFDGTDLDIQDCLAGEILGLIYDGAYYQLQNATPPRQRLFLPFYPETTYPDTGILNVTGATGSVTVETGQKFVWRASVEIRTNDFAIGLRQISTTGSKTYHLRWHAPGTGDAVAVATYPHGRFVLKDLTDGTYNSGGAVEQSDIFDSVYDDMLIARVVTNSQNNPTITALINKHYIETTLTQTKANFLADTDEPQPVLTTLNWARAGMASWQSLDCSYYNYLDSVAYLYVPELTRYLIRISATGYNWQYNYTDATFVRPSYTVHIVTKKN